MKFFRRSLLLALLAAAFLSSCSTLCCNKASARIEADIAMATEKKEDVEAAQKNAYKRIAWAKDINLESDFPEKFGDAMGSLRPADLAYDNVKYATAKRLYLEVSEILSDEFMAKALECRNERAKVEMAIKEALEACADSLAPQRFKDAQDLYIKAQALKAADDLPNALAACRKAAAAFNYAAEYSRTIKLRDSIRDCQALKDYSKEYLQAEEKILEDEALWKHGTVKDYALGISILHEAGRQYSWIVEQCRKLKEEQRLEAERMLLAAEKLAAEKAAADGALACAKDGMSWAETNSLGVDYADDYSKAKAELAEAEATYAAGNYICAATSATKVCEFFSDQYRTAVLAERARIAAEKAAAEKLASEKAAADGALACAKDGMAWAETNSLGVGYPDDYTRAKAQLAEAEAAYTAGDFVGARDTAKKVCEFFSDQYRAAVLAERARIAAEKAAAEKAAAEKLAAEKALADRLAAEKAAADGALACAKDGMSWAETNSLGVDFPDDYTRAKTQLAEASTVYEAGDYVGAGAMATKVCKFFSDQYRAAVLAERARIAAEKAAAEKAAAEKLAAEKALADRLAAEKASQERAEKERLAREKAEPTKPVVKTSPEFFSPDDDGIDDLISFDTDLNKDTEVKNWVLEVFEEYIVDPSAKTYSVAKRSFRTWTGNGMPPARIAWDGKSDKDELVQSGTTYPYAFTYTDKQNRTTGTQGVVIVGIIAQKSGDTISIKLPSLVFRADKSDFLDLDPHVVERNNLLIVKLADSLKKYSDYHITVEGHANNIGKMIGYSQARIDEEEKQQVLPLSAGRAEKLKAMLIDQGIDPSLISVIGYGSSKPVVSFTDVVNRWKNRRVEFTLTKKNSR